MTHENKSHKFMSWQEKMNELAQRFCQDENDRRLIDIETYEVRSREWESKRLEPVGEFGDWVEVEDFRKLAERFLLAMELIHTMEGGKLNENI